MSTFSSDSSNYPSSFIPREAPSQLAPLLDLILIPHQELSQATLLLVEQGKSQQVGGVTNVFCLEHFKSDRQLGDDDHEYERRDRPLLLNGNDDEYERPITLLGYLFGSVRAIIIRILAGYISSVDNTCSVFASSVVPVYSNSVSVACYLARLPIWYAAMVDLQEWSSEMSNTKYMLLSNGNDEYERSMTWLGYLFGIQP
ncbi:hypothetical protein Tco_0623078 [Tanacetum coccineum]